jgi:mRNA interferase HicA
MGDPLLFSAILFTILLDFVTINGYISTVTSKELKRWLEKQGATFTPGKGSHLHVEVNGKFSVLPMHGKDLGLLANTIKKQLGLK